MGFRFVDNKRQGGDGAPKKVFYRNRQGEERSRSVDDLLGAAMVLVAESIPDAQWAELPVDALVHWLIDGVENGRADGTPPRGQGYVNNVRTRLRNHFLPVFEGKAIGTISSPALSTFRLSLGEDLPGRRALAPETVTAICHTVDMLFRECVEVGIIPGPPPSEKAFATMTRSFRPNTVRSFEPEERALMLDPEAEPVGLFIAHCLFHAAMREDEIAALALDDVGTKFLSIKRVRLRDGTLGDPGNSERLRDIKLEPELRRHLQKLAWKGFDRKLPILGQLAGVKVKYHLVGSRFRQLQVAVGVVDDVGEPRYTPLEGRHTCIIDWLSKPHDLDELRRKAGIASVERLLETYAKWVFDPTDVETFDLADEELTIELRSAERGADDLV